MKQTTVGFHAIKLNTPIWVKVIFFMILCITTVLTVWVAGTTLIQVNHKTELMLAFKAVDMLAAMVAPMFGLKSKPKLENDGEV